MKSLLLSCVLVLSVACSAERRGGPGDQGNANGAGTGTNNKVPTKINTGNDEELAQCQKMDILFVIDDSLSMEAEQQNLIMNFPEFVRVLDEYRTETGEGLDYHLGVTTTAVSATISQNVLGFPAGSMFFPGDDGALRGECGMNGNFISSMDDDVTGKFSCVANVGVDGPPREMPLAAIEHAVTTRVGDGTNTGFLREDALLGVVVLTDEDDCSYIDPSNVEEDGLSECAPATLHTVDRYVQVLDGVKGSRDKWATAVIAGPAGGQPCSGEFGDAAPATRLNDFVTKTGQNGVFSSICTGDLAMALEDAINTFDIACQNWMLL